jgi:hypothetical protein
MATENNELDLNSLFEEIDNEVDEEIEAERMNQLTPQDRILAQIASDILRLERDMTMPGRAVQDATRIDRLAKFIEEAKF